MTQTKTVAVEVDDRNIQRPWDESDLVTDWSAFPRGYGILLNERLIFPEDLCLWRMKIDTTRQLFVDDHLIAHQRDLKREFHSPQDHPANPVLTHLRGDGLSTAYGQYVCPDEEHGYRMYYGGPGAPIYVAYSTDGVNWDKPDLNVYDHSAKPEKFMGGPNNAVAGDAYSFGLLRMTNVDTVGGPLVKDDELWFYYMGQYIDGPKGAWQQKTGLAILRRDGFATLNAGEEAGIVITRPLVFEGEGELFVNADVATNGHVRTSVVAEDGSAIEGFNEDDCQAVCADSTRSRVGWGQQRDPGQAERSVCSPGVPPDERETVLVLDRVGRPSVAR